MEVIYGSPTTVTLSGINSLVNGDNTTSSTINNTTTRFIDVLVEVIVNHSSAPSSTGYIEVGVKGSIDNTDFDDDANSKWIGNLLMSSTATGTRKRVFSIASSFGGVMPPYWQVRINNLSGASLGSSGNSVSYCGIKAQTV